MITKDRQLLALVRRMNGDMGDIVLKLVRDLPDGQLPPDMLRELAGIFGGLADALTVRAAEIDGGEVAHPLVVEGETG